MNPQDRVALVTGGARRVGRAISLALGRAGAHVVLHYHASREAADVTAADLRTMGVEVLPFQADVSRPEQVEAMVEAARDRFGKIDILVNSAATFERTPFPEAPVDAWQRVLAVNLTGPFLVARAVAPLMLAQGEGVIVNVVDLMAARPSRIFLAHGVSKAGLKALTEALAVALAPAVRVNAVMPGPVLAPPAFTPQQVARQTGRTLLKRWGSPDDVARAVLFLVESDYVTGHTLVVDGGGLLA
jgi:NAD(P)-dependent dehydrogenase (short-subunit alcohol dehydrogenase family)